jgi:putative sterol carrier protein
MSLDSSTQNIRDRIGADSGIGATLTFDFGDEGRIFIDATAVPNRVDNSDSPAQCTIGVTLADFEAMLAGDLAPATAFMGGKLRVDGDMGVAMKLQSMLG